MNLRECARHTVVREPESFDLFESDVKDYFVGQYGPESLIYQLK